MPKLADKNRCTGCSACANICPQKCIKMEKDEIGFEYPKVIEQSMCISCRACERVCPVLSNKKNIEEMSALGYAAYSKSDIIRMQSSSGGVFTELATVILQSGGVIYGAGYDIDGVVRHFAVEDPQKLGELRGAKYSQSVLGDCFKVLKKQLDSGRNVLFSGTPCQVAGLKAYLRVDYRNLMCVDFVCHGIPSPKVWQEYLRYRAQIDNEGELPIRIDLRNKESGWSRYSYSVNITYEGNKKYCCKNEQDMFMRLFVNDYILRECCDNCHFKGYDRVSDITLGDFWGIWDIAPQMDDNKGTSLVLIHSGKGIELFETIRDRLEVQEVSLQEASAQNPSLLASSQHNKERQKILRLALSGEFDEIDKYLNKRMYGNGVLRRLRRIFRL